ncbi:MAG TPA: oligosaccharide flippase family protein [Cytophagaceae bacterium]|nr:oligosaccharide flippase family protein [Cytophagaceae bacterium]
MSEPLNVILPIRKLFGNISFVVILNVLIKPVWLFLENDVQNKIGHKDFGLYTALFSLGYIFASLTDIGLNQFITKKIASEPTRIKEIFSNIFALKLLMLIVYPILMSLVGWIMGYNERELYFLLVLCLAQALVQLLFFFRANFQANQHFMVDSTASIMDKFILLLLVVVMLSQRINLDLFIYARLASLVVTVMVFYFVSIRLFDYIAPKLNPRKLKTLIQQSIPFAVITVLYSLNEKVDSIIIEYLSRTSGNIAKEAHAGLYAAAYRFLDASMMYLWTILPLFFAKFAYHLHDKKEKQRLINFGQVVAAVPMIFIAVFIYFYGETLFFQQKNSTTEEITTMTNVLKILFVSAALQGMFALYSTLLTATGYEKKVSMMIVGSILINIVGNFIFIPIYGPIASAWITVVSTVFLSVSYLYYTHTKLDIEVPYSIIFRLFLVVVLFSSVFYLLTLTTLPWYLVTMLAGAFLLLFSYLAGLINLMLSRD